MWVRNSTSKLAFISGMGSQPSTAPTHHTQSASVLSKTSTPTVVSAEPLYSYAQMTSAKLVIELPSAENVCVDHRRRNGPNAVRAGLSQSFGKNLNAENFFEIFKMKLHEALLLLNKNKKFVLKMQSLRTVKRSMRTRPGSDFAWSFYTAKLHIFSFFLKNCRIIRSILK